MVISHVVRQRCVAPIAAAGFLAAAAVAAKAGALIAGDPAALSQIAFAVDGAESSHGADRRMWRAEPAGPQGPMQVSAAAAADVGGGDRFDMVENRALGRAYLTLLYRRYANWPDAVAAYNWGPGKMDAWIGAGRPSDKFPLAVSLYRMRVLFGASGMRGGARRLRSGVTRSRRPLADLLHPSRESLVVEQLYVQIMAQTERFAR